MSEHNAPALPVDAATVVVARDASDGPEVLLLKRNASVAFMASAWVYPGGRVDAADAAPQLRQYLPDCELVFARAGSIPDPTQAMALVATAVRECLEEAGILLATGSPDALAAALTERERLQRGERTLLDLLAAHGLRVDTSALAYFAHWITPPFERRRYDTRFFLARAPAEQSGTHDDGETVASRWIRPADAVALNEAGEITLPPPTLRSLWHLSRFADVDAMFAWARNQDVLPIEPAMFDDNGALALVFPGHPAHTAAYAVEAPVWASMVDGRWKLRE